MRKFRSGLISVFFTLFILFILFQKAEIGELRSIIETIDYLPLFVAALFYFLLNLALSYRFYILANYDQYNVPYVNILRYHFSSMILSDVTPGRVGYFSIIYYLKDRINIENSTNYVFIGQFLDILLKIFGILLFVTLFTTVFVGDNRLEFLTIFLFLVSIALLFSVILWSKKFVDFIGQKIGNSIVRKIIAFVSQIQKSSDYNSFLLVKCFSISLIGWFFVGTQWYFVALALDIDIFNIFQMLIIQAVATSFSFLPFVIGGIGLQESAIITILFTEGINYSQALSFGIIVRGMSMVIDILFGVWYLGPKK